MYVQQRNREEYKYSMLESIEGVEETEESNGNEHRVLLSHETLVKENC